QAEDGIRDGHVTGVQTCALPILLGCVETALAELSRACTELQTAVTATDARADRLRRGHHNLAEALDDAVTASRAARALAARCVEIGRASCRERGDAAVRRRS